MTNNDTAVMPQVAAENVQTTNEKSQLLSKLTDEGQEELLANFSPLYVGMQNILPNDVTDFDEVISHLDISKSNRKRLYFVLFELLQNTIKNQNKEYVEQSKFLMYESNGKLKIEISNYVQGDIQAEKVKTILKNVDAISFQELRGISTDTLNNKLYTEEGGAGRGFYEIAKMIRKIDPEADSIFSCEKEATTIDGVSNLVITVEFSLKREDGGFKLAA